MGMLATEIKQAPPEAGFGAVRTAEGCLPLRQMAVEAHIVGLFHRLEVRQTFVNAYPVPLEATYIFPLPARSGVRKFRLEIGERVVDGVLQERGQARQAYDRAVSEGRRAAIVEEERTDVFTVRAGNIPAGESVTVALELSGPLAYLDDEATFRFPLVVAPRYIPGQALPGPSVGSGTAADTDAVPDASRITPPTLLPGMPNPVHLSLVVHIDPAGLHFGTPHSSLHEVLLSPGRAELRPGVERLDRDFVLHLPVLGEGLRSSFVTEPDGKGEHTFLLTVVPPSLHAAGAQPRDVVVVLDRSGSMEGWRMVAARRAAARILESLTEHDRFAIVAFNSNLRMPFPELRTADPWTVQQAVDFLGSIQANGGTRLGPALSQACNLVTGAGDLSLKRDRTVVLVTDGQVGNEEQLLGCFGHRPLRLHAVGIDQAVNEGLLRRLAENNGGLYFGVESQERLEAAMRSLHHRLCQPALTGVKLAGLTPLDSTPAHCDAFPGTPAFLLGKLGKVPDGSVRVTGTWPDGSAYDVAVPVHHRQESVFTTAWARARILDLQDLYAAGTDLAASITAFSLQWGVLSRFTSFVACDEVQAVSRSVPGVKATVPVEGLDKARLVQDFQSLLTVREPVVRYSPSPFGVSNPVGFGGSFGQPPALCGPAGTNQGLLATLELLIETERKLYAGFHNYLLDRSRACSELAQLLRQLFVTSDVPGRERWQRIERHLRRWSFAQWAPAVVEKFPPEELRTDNDAVDAFMEEVFEVCRRHP